MVVRAWNQCGCCGLKAGSVAGFFVTPDRVAWCVTCKEWAESLGYKWPAWPRRWVRVVLTPEWPLQ